MTLIEAGQRRRNRAVIAVVVTAAVFLSFVAVMYSSYAGGRGGGAVATETPSPLPVVAVAGSEGVIKLPHRDEAPTFRAEPLLSDAHIVQGGAAKQAQLLDKMGAFWDGRLRWKMRDEMVSNNYSSSSIPPLLSSYPSSQFDSLATVLGEEWRKREEKDTRARASAYYETSQSASPLPIYTGGGEKGHLIELDYQDPSHQLYAEYLIEREVPFVVRRVTDVRRVSLKWGEQYFRQKMKDTKVGVDKSNFDRFMYYTLARGTPSGWVPPQDKEEMSVKSFLITATKEPKAVKPTDMHYYWQVAGGNKEKPEYEWVQQV
uniref:Uncharacterized protein n=1 Tax=Palpitomonas bilix TaxID=652834 RepID=A0A7S3CW53_9EUKA|mmetsp:Transcript_11770/g.31676  ORF Transcript_11770/g.31676 Transcript_11770/m.31676 type:complete len:317 (+) Transcript_11770:242-1192(+)